MRPPLAKKIRIVVISSLATTALSIPALSALSVTAHDAGKRVVTPSSHRLALTLRPASVRLT
jgi:hypothetical protein